MTTLNATRTTREKACGLVLNGLQSITEGLLMYHELGMTTKEIYADLQAAGWNKSLRVLQRYQTELRKDGLLPKAYDSSSRFAKSGEIPVENFAAKSGGKPVENSTPKITLETFRHQTDDSLSSTVQLRNTAECIEPSVCYVQPNMGTNMGSDQEVVSMGTEAERDLELCYEYFEKIARITGKYLFGGWREDQWYGIHGECKGISEAARIRSADLRRRIEQHASDLADSFDPTGAPRLCEVTDNDGE